jgi:Transcription termination factor nusG
LPGGRLPVTAQEKQYLGRLVRNTRRCSNVKAAVLRLSSPPLFCCGDLMGWQIILTRPNCEGKVRRQLDDEGIESYFPLQRRWRRARHKRHPVLTVRPAFPGYVFARGPIGFHLRDGRPLIIGDWLAEVRLIVFRALSILSMKRKNLRKSDRRGTSEVPLSVREPAFSVKSRARSSRAATVGAAILISSLNLRSGGLCFATNCGGIYDAGSSTAAYYAKGIQLDFSEGRGGSATVTAVSLRSP